MDGGLLHGDGVILEWGLGMGKGMGEVMECEY